MSHFIPWPTKKDISECAWKVLEKGALELGSVLVLHRHPGATVFGHFLPAQKRTFKSLS